MKRTLLKQFNVSGSIRVGWLMVADGYGPVEYGVLVDIAVSLDMMEFTAIIGSCVSWR